MARRLSENPKLWGGMSFEEFVKAVYGIEDKYANDHFKSQYLFLIDNKGRRLPDFIGTLENLEEDFNFICRKIGLSNIYLPTSNKTNKNVNYKDYYNKKLEEMVRERYKKDIELYNSIKSKNNH